MRTSSKIRLVFGGAARLPQVLDLHGRTIQWGGETVLFPATWKDGDWPALQQVRDRMSSWPLPPQTRARAYPEVAIPGSGPFIEDPDIVDFPPDSAIPPHFLYWRFPPKDAFAVSPQGHPNTLRLRPPQSNLTSSAPLSTLSELSLIMRVQTDTLFRFSVDNNGTFVPYSPFSGSPNV